MQDHIAKAFDADLHDLKHKVAEMGGIAERQVVEATDSLVRHDIDLARRVIAMDRTTDLLQREIEEKSILTITKRQPVAADLREIVAALRVAGDLERIGDLAKNIAKREIVIGAGLRRIEALRGFGHMAELALSQIKDVLDAYAQRDPAAARAVWERDQEIDAIHNSLFRELLTYMMEDPREITFCTHLMFCAKNIERIGDHATNIAETIHYMVEGRMLAEERPKAEMTASTGSVAPSSNGS